MLYYKMICSGEWVDAGWPFLSYMELDNNRYQTKILEIRKDGIIAFAYDNIENGTFLAEEAYPTEDELNSEKNICLQEISYDEFQEVWSCHVKKAMEQ